MKIQSLNFRAQPDVTQYPEQLQMLIVAQNYSVLSTIMSYSFSVPMTWLSLADSMAVFNKTMKVVTFYLMNDKLYKLTKRQFAQIMMLSYTGSFYEVKNE